MNIERTAVDEFWVGHGGADAQARPLVQRNYAPQRVLKGVRVRAATANTTVVYVGPAGVSVDSGYPLPAGEEITVEIADVSKVCIVAAPAANCQQTVTLAGTVVGETFTLVLNGVATAAIATNAAAAAVKTALEGVVGPGNVDVSGDAGGPYTVEFKGALAKTDVALMTSTDGGINERQTIVVTGGVAGDKLVLTYGGQSTAELDYDISSADLQTALRALPSINGANVAVTDGDPADWVIEFIGALARTDVAVLAGVCGKNEKQTITLDASVSDGTFTLTFGADTTAALAYDISAADLQTALCGLPSVGGANVVVTAGTPRGWVVEFVGALAHSDVAAITGDGTNLVGDVKDVTVVETVKGNSATVDVTETQQGDAGFTVTVAKVADITGGSKYSWIAC